jgi:hypothetical protein
MTVLDIVAEIVSLLDRASIEGHNATLIAERFDEAMLGDRDGNEDRTFRELHAVRDDLRSLLDLPPATDEDHDGEERTRRESGPNLPLPVRFAELEDVLREHCAHPHEGMNRLCATARLLLDEAIRLYEQGEYERATRFTDELAKLFGVWF